MRPLQYPRFWPRELAVILLCLQLQLCHFVTEMLQVERSERVRHANMIPKACNTQVPAAPEIRKRDVDIYFGSKKTEIKVLTNSPIREIKA